jgi:hypothetical protein
MIEWLQAHVFFTHKSNAEMRNNFIAWQDHLKTEGKCIAADVVQDAMTEALSPQGEKP